MSVSPQADSTPSVSNSEITPEASLALPIAAPTHPRQYRAIGLIKGRYEPSEEHLTRGTLHTAQGLSLDAVLLGRMISLVKNHVDLTQEHLWVVYPRTKIKENPEDEAALHVQMVGIWEPETLKPDANATPLPEEEQARIRDGYFSIRGQVVYSGRTEEDQAVVVKIRQSPRKPTDKPKFFKLQLQGKLPSDRPVNHFWDIHVQLEGTTLTVQGGEDFGGMGNKKKRNNQRRPGDKPFRKPSGDRPERPQGERPPGDHRNTERPERPMPVRRFPRPEIK